MKNSREFQYPQDDFKIAVENDRLSMDVKSTDLLILLKEIARKTNIALTFSDQDIINESVSIKMTDVSIEDALGQLLKNRALVFERLPDGKSFKIVKAFGASESKRTDASADRSAPVSHDKDAPDSSFHQKTGALKSEGHITVKKPGTGTNTELDKKGRPKYKKGEVLIRFKDEVSDETIAKLHQSLGSSVLDKIDRFNIQRVQLSKKIMEDEAIKNYISSGLVEMVEKHSLRYADAVTPNDTYYPNQWSLYKINAPEAWEITTGSDVPIIAVIDTGVDYVHPDLISNIWINSTEANGLFEVDDDANGFVDDIHGWDFAGSDSASSDDQDDDPMDVEGHGTHVAGIIAARGNNSIGISGVSWHAKIMPLKVQADNATEMEIWDIINAIDYAIENGARIVNCSFGGEAFSTSEQEAFSVLGTAGIIAVCAAGNDGLNTDEEENRLYPAGYALDNIISVAASNQSDSLAGFSNYGLTSVDVAAPGTQIKSTIPATTYTDAYIRVAFNQSSSQYDATGMSYAGETDESGIGGILYNCGKGYPAEFPSAVNGNIALIQRGNKEGFPLFYFYQKTTNAQNAGAIGVIIYNNEPGIFSGTLVYENNWIPVVSISKEDGETIVDIPGQPTVTLVNKPMDTPTYYANKDGTSMAAPFASGIAGLLLSVNPLLSYSQIKTAILNTVDVLPDLENKLVSGGRVNALSALCSITAIPGDLSCNDSVGIEDAIISLQLMAGLTFSFCTPCILSTSDVNNDDRIGIEETVYILQIVSGMRE